MYSTGTGPLATNGIDAGVKIRPTEDELKQMDKWSCPEFRSGWDSYFKDKPDKPVMHYSVIAGYVYPSIAFTSAMDFAHLF